MGCRIQHHRVRSLVHDLGEESTGQRLTEKVRVASASKPMSTEIVWNIYHGADKITVSYLI